jgi:hypothetical protein
LQSYRTRYNGGLELSTTVDVQGAQDKSGQTLFSVKIKNMEKFNKNEKQKTLLIGCNCLCLDGI